MASTRLARGKKPSLKTHAEKPAPRRLPPAQQVIDFLFDEDRSIQVPAPIVLEVGQTVLFVVWTRPMPSPTVLPTIGWKPKLLGKAGKCLLVAETERLNAFVGAFTPDEEGNYKYEVSWMDDGGEGPRTASGTIEVSGGGEDKQLKGPQGGAARRRVGRSTRG